MIKLKGVGEILVDLSVPGTQAVNANAKTFVVPFAARLKAVYAKLGTAGTTGSETADLKQNGASLLASGSLLTFASGAQAATYASNYNSNPPTFAKGDILELAISAIHTTPAKDLALLIVLERQRSGSWNDPVQTDTIGADSDAI